VHSASSGNGNFPRKIRALVQFRPAEPGHFRGRTPCAGRVRRVRGTSRR
jgi:hypothetical protein